MIKVIFLTLGIVSFMMPVGSGLAISLLFGAVMLVFFSAAGYIYDFNFLYVYGVLLALAMPVGEWLYQTAGFSHHGLPVVFGSIAVIMFVRGLFKFITLLKDTPHQAEEQTL